MRFAGKIITLACQLQFFPSFFAFPFFSSAVLYPCPFSHPVYSLDVYISPVRSWTRFSPAIPDSHRKAIRKAHNYLCVLALAFCESFPFLSRYHTSGLLLLVLSVDHPPQRLAACTIVKRGDRRIHPLFGLNIKHQPTSTTQVGVFAFASLTQGINTYSVPTNIHTSVIRYFSPRHFFFLSRWYQALPI